MKKLVFKKWVEMVVELMLAFGLFIFLLSCIVGIQKLALLCLVIIIVLFNLLGIYGRFNVSR